MRIDLVANGLIKDLTYFKKEIKRSDLIIAADAGYDYILNAGIIADIFVGDMDSVCSNIDHDVHQIVLKKDKDKSDLEIALDLAVSLKPSDVYIWGALGKRLDHQFFNIDLLLKYKKNNIKIKDHDVELFLVNHGYHFKDFVGKTVSFFLSSDKVTGLTLKGFKYGLSEKTIKKGNTILLSNRIIKKNATVSLLNGSLYCIINYEQK